MMWADPVDNNDGHSESPYKPNEVRGCSYFFGYSPVKTFLEKTKCLSIIRAHEAQAEGFKMYKWNGATYFPVVITIFSAPNYCDVYKNRGAVIKFKVRNILNSE
jgi:serine/threonine-protein phosphatase 2B catalytic subunit